MINELIEQIGGRGRLVKLVTQYDEDGYCDVQDDEVIAALRALLAVLDAQEKPFMYAISDCEGQAHFDESCVSAHRCDLEDVVGSLNEFRDDVDDGYSIVPVYTTPPAASVSEIITVAKAMREWIDAIPKDVVASLPAMPGFDRDWADEVISSVAPAPENKK